MTVRARPYRSTLRDEQAQATRRRIVRAGGELFVERGYGPTTIDAIAERAEVSRKTVFTSVGGKAAVLKLAFDWALAGDDEPVAIADRPEVRRMMQEQDPAALLDAWIAMNAAIAGRLAALHHVLVVAADADPEAAAMLATTEHQRRARRPGAVDAARGDRWVATRPRPRPGRRDHRGADGPAALPAPRAPAGLDARGVHRVPPANGRSSPPAVSFERANARPDGLAHRPSATSSSSRRLTLRA